MKKFKKFFIVFILFSFVLFGVSFISKATLINFNVLEISSFDDGLYDNINGYNMNGRIFGYYEIDNNRYYFMDTYSTIDNYHILISSNTFDNGNDSPEYEDYGYAIYSSDINTLISNINNYLLNNTDYNTILSNNKTFIINDYISSIGYYENGGALLIDDLTYENIYPDYLTNVGIKNTYMLYGLFMSKISYYNNQYTQEQISNLLENYEEDLEDARNDGYLDGYNAGSSVESITSAFNDGYNKGYDKGLSDGVNNKQTFLSYIFKLFDDFINGISTMFNVEVFGINLSSIIIFIISIAIIGFVLRRLF